MTLEEHMAHIRKIQGPPPFWKWLVTVDDETYRAYRRAKHASTKIES